MMFVLALILALQGVVFIGGGHMSDVHEIHGGGQVFVESIMENDDSSVSELHRSLAFYPPSLDFGSWPVGTAKSTLVTLVNKNTNRSVYLSSISGKTTDFYSSFFEDKVVPPQGNTTFSVVFLPRTYGHVKASLLIHSSFGQAKLPVKGEGESSPYKLKPLIGIKAPLNATITPEIVMYNPHSKPLQILEVYSSGGQFQLELPTGSQEGPQVLWEIPPYTSKPVIRIRFHGAQAGNHTAYIRIKISGIEDDKEESILVVPVEFEILTNYGIYSPFPIINFGRTTANDEAKMIKINLTNSGKDKIEVIDYKLRNVNSLVELQKSDLTLILNSKQASGNTIINGELIIKTQSKQSSSQFLELSVGIRAEIYRGSLEFEKNLTVFITGAQNYTKEDRSFVITNAFNVPVAITNLTIEKNDTKVFRLTGFMPTILSPGEKITLFKIAAVNESANFISSLVIESNITAYPMSIVVCRGLLKRYTSIDSVNFSRLPDEQILDFGTVPFGAVSHFAFILMTNPNPIPIQLLKWNFTNPQGVFYHSMFLGCASSSPDTVDGDDDKQGKERFKLCLSVSSSDTGAFELALQSYNVKSFTGVFKIWTEVEEIITTVKFVTVMGHLEVDQSKLQFKDCFPGKRCTADISIHSTFLKTMRVKSITVSVPGLVFEYNTVSPNGLPEIIANKDTAIGKIHFDPKSVCAKKCYIPQEGDNEAEPYKNKENLDFNETELRRRTENFRRFKWDLQSISFTLDTTEVRRFQFNSSVDIVWPKLVKAPQIIPATEVGQVYEGLIWITNPSSENLLIEINLSDPKKAKSTSLSLPLEVVEICVFCYLTDQDVFSLDGKTIERSEYFIKAQSMISVPIKFIGNEAGTFSTLMHIRNNLTLYEAVWITAKAVQPQFRFGSRKPGSISPLLFEINDRYLNSCNKAANGEEQVIVTTKRTFTARNAGEVPIFVESFHIGEQECEGYGFKILDCVSFELKANSSKKIDIAFTPDFTMTRITRPLILKTNLSYAVNYTLLATVPTSSIESCAKALGRPFWESHMKKISVGMLAAAFMFVLIAAFLDSDKVLKDHVHNMSKDKGPMQPPLDLRNIGPKQSNNMFDNTYSNGTASYDKSQNRIANTSSARKRNLRRNCAQPQTAGVGRDKSWAEELAKKISTTSGKTNDRAASPDTRSTQGTSALPKQQSPSYTTPVKLGKEDKHSPPQKKSPKEIPLSVPTEKATPSKAPAEEIIKTSETKTDSPQIDLKKPKLLIKKSKSLQSASIEQRSPLLREQTDPSIVQDRSQERLSKVSKTPKEKSDTQVQISSDKRAMVTQHEPYISPVPENLVHSESPEKPTTKAANNQRKYGKTPGRERKKDVGQPKRLERKAPKFKGTAFQFSSPISGTGQLPLPSSCSVWDPSQASFSHVVAQKSVKPIDQSCVNTARKEYEEVNNGHDWNEADLKNHETFGIDAEPVRNSTDLGPIGTRKSPSSTPIWEPLMHNNLHRPTPNMTVPQSSTNSSFFSSNFPIGTNLEYTNDNQYLGGASGLLDHLISESQQQRRWRTNDAIISMLQQGGADQGTPRHQPEWAMEGRMWTPMGYQDDTPSLIPDQINVWQRPGGIRPPPGLGLPKQDSPVQNQANMAQNMSPSQNNTERVDAARSNDIPPYDPFSSLSSIWANPWSNKNDKN